MTNTLIILSYVLSAAAIVIGCLISERKGLKQSLEDVRADRNKAWAEISKLHAERIAEIHRAADRINVMTDRLRAANDAHFANNATKEN